MALGYWRRTIGMIIGRLPRAGRLRIVNAYGACRCTQYACIYTSAIASTPPSSLYDATITNLNIGENTRVIFQGFTGKQATFDAKQSLEYGTKIVGGVKPGGKGEHLGLPVLPSMRMAMEQLKPDATAVYVAAGQAAGAIEEAIAAEIPLIVAVAEHVPVHDMLRIHSILKTQSKSRLVGPNTPGMISPHGKCRIGFPPIPFFSPGDVAIVARSGTLSYETVASTTRAGLGQSLVIGVGGDMLPGTNFVDALMVFEHDEASKGIILVGEIGGTAEIMAAEWIKTYRKRSKTPKPIMGLIAGLQAVKGREMGHAGAFMYRQATSAAAKLDALEAAGVVTVDHPAKFGVGMKKLLHIENKASTAGSSIPQKRSLHTSARGSRPRIFHQTQITARRHIHIWGQRALSVLEANQIGVWQGEEIPIGTIRLRCFINTDDRQPVFSWLIKTPKIDWRYRIPFQLDEHMEAILDRVKHTRFPLSRGWTSSFSSVTEKLLRLFTQSDAVLFEVWLIEQYDQLVAVGATLNFDDAAYRSAGRQKDMQALRVVGRQIAEEVGAERDGIVYIKLKGKGSIGTLVNGAGLAMNTTDAIHSRGGHCANFLDTGGKATRDTVKASFRIILEDSRVKTIFVNIFGGLTLCDMIAEGILLAYRDLGITLPVVVRLRGTNEKIGQKMIADSGLPLHIYDDFEEAAQKVIELAKAGDAGKQRMIS